MANDVPRLIILYVRQCLTGLALGIAFSVVLVIFNVGNIGHLVDTVDGGWLAFAMLCVFNGIVFAGVQFGVSIMGLADRDDDG